MSGNAAKEVAKDVGLGTLMGLVGKMDEGREGKGLNIRQNCMILLFHDEIYITSFGNLASHYAPKV